MARQPRIEYPGAVYHIMSRGNHGEAVFHDDEERTLWLETLGQACEKTGWRIHAYILMRNHYHFLLETPEANLVAGMKWFQGTFTQRVNARRRARGHLFQGRYKALVVDPDEKRHFDSVVMYIHLNPVRAGLVGREPKSLRQYRWSSYTAYLSRPKQRPPWLVVSRTLWALGLKDRLRDRSVFEDHTEEKILDWRRKRGKKALEEEWKSIRRGWFLGGERFRAFILEFLEKVMEGKRRDSFSGAGAASHDEKEAERLLERGFEVLGIDDGTLMEMKKGAEEKAALAMLIRNRTTVSNRWIADRLCMGHPGRVSHLVRMAREVKTGRLRQYCKKLNKMSIF